MIPKVTIAPKWQVPWESYMQRGEREILLTLLDSVTPRRVIEFGVNEGITARMALQTISSIMHYTGVDVPFDHRTVLPWQQKEVPEHPGRLVGDARFELVLRDGGSADDRIAAGEPYDAAFIDGDHSRRAVETDYRLAKRIVRSGGIIVFHDYDNTAVEVTEAIDAFYREGSALLHVAGTWLVFERV